MLTEMQIKNATIKDNRYLLHDEHGLYLEIMPSGTKTWRFRYSQNKKQYKITVGKHPLMPLKDARALRDKLRMQLLEGQTPSLKAPAHGEDISVSFEYVFAEWKEKRVLPRLAPDYAQDIIARANNHILPFIGDSEIRSIQSRDVLDVVRRVEARGNTHMAKRVKQICGQVFRFGVAAGYCDLDPTSAIGVAMQAHVTQNNPAITDPAHFGMLLRSIEAYPSAVVRAALQMHALVFLRPGELRRGEWVEIDWENKRWEISKEKMKLRRPHVVPLSSQALSILEHLQPITGNGKYIFPSSRAPRGDRPMSENTINCALRAMGYSGDDMCAHGFRTSASTMLNEHSWNYDWIEMQLAHAPKDAIRGTYNRAQYWDGRVEMMQWWADYLDGLRAAK